MPPGWPTCWPRAPAARRHPPSPPTACTSSGRTTMHGTPSPSAPPRWTGCPEAKRMPSRTRIKICGLTREADVDAAVEAGADAIGLVFYEKSPRRLDVARAAALARRLPPFVAPVGLFVNAKADLLSAAGQGVADLVLPVHR